MVKMSEMIKLSAKQQSATIKRLFKYTVPYKGTIALAFIMLTLKDKYWNI